MRHAASPANAARQPCLALTVPFSSSSIPSTKTVLVEHPPSTVRARRDPARRRDQEEDHFRCERSTRTPHPSRVAAANPNSKEENSLDFDARVFSDHFLAGNVGVDVARWRYAEKMSPGYAASASDCFAVSGARA
jgi:hypothetical protein